MLSCRELWVYRGLGWVVVGPGAMFGICKIRLSRV